MVGAACTNRELTWVWCGTAVRAGGAGVPGRKTTREGRQAGRQAGAPIFAFDGESSLWSL